MFPWAPRVLTYVGPAVRYTFRSDFVFAFIPSLYLRILALSLKACASLQPVCLWYLASAFPTPNFLCQLRIVFALLLLIEAP